jgi:hypothetical protein
MFDGLPVNPVKVVAYEFFHNHIIGNCTQSLTLMLAMMTEAGVGDLNSSLKQWFGAGKFPSHWDKLPHLELQGKLCE